MPLDPITDKASRILDSGLRNQAWYVDGERSQGTYLARMLEAERLLVTPLHERALEASERYYLDRCGDKSSRGYPGDDLAKIGHESLAAKEPKERWVASPAAYALPGVVPPYRVGEQLSEGLSRVVTLDLTEPQARAVAAALNALDAKP